MTKLSAKFHPALIGLRLRRVHFWLGIVIGAQTLLWLVSGLFMVMVDIDEVRGAHLRTEQAPIALKWQADWLSPGAIEGAVDFPVTAMSLRLVNDQPLWLLEGASGRVLIDAVSGRRVDGIDSVGAVGLAHGYYAGQGRLIKAEFEQKAPREAASHDPLWRVEFGPQDRASIYVNAVTGELRAVRTPLWRVFDFFWGLHIMDWSTRENFNSWWLRATSAFAFLFALAGAGLVIVRLQTMMKRNKKHA